MEQQTTTLHSPVTETTPTEATSTTHLPQSPTTRLNTARCTASPYSMLLLQSQTILFALPQHQKPLHTAFTEAAAHPPSPPTPSQTTT